MWTTKSIWQGIKEESATQYSNGWTFCEIYGNYNDSLICIILQYRCTFWNKIVQPAIVQQLKSPAITIDLQNASVLWTFQCHPFLTPKDNA